MINLSGLTIEMALGGSYRQEVLDDAPIGWWRLNASMNNVVLGRDISGSAHHSTNTVNVTPNTTQLLTESAACGSFAAGYVDFGNVDILEFTVAFSVEFWIQRNGNPSNFMWIAGCYDWVNSTGWNVRLTTGGFIAFQLRNNAGGNRFDLTGTVSVTDDEPHHVVCTREVGTPSNGVKIYIDGVLDSQMTAAAGTSSTVNRFLIGAADGASSSNYLTASLADVVAYSTALSGTRVLAHYTAGLWTDVSDDLIRANDYNLSFGVRGGGPQDRIPDQGLSDFWLRNDENSSGGLGYYSPNHANVRSGFRRGALVRIQFSYFGTTAAFQFGAFQIGAFQAGVTEPYTRFIGKIIVIDPQAGRNASRQTHVVVSDMVYDLNNTDLRNVTLQTNVGEDDALLALMEALPVIAQPLGLDFDAGVDTLPYVFDDLGAGAKAIGTVSDLAISSLGYVYVTGRGILRYENRLNRQASSPSYTIDNELLDLAIPSSLDGVYNHFRLISTQRTIDASPTRVLFSIPTASATNPSTIEVAAGATIEIWGQYFDPNNVIRNLSGTNGQQPVATTDYLANAAADGTGTNKTAQVTIAVTFFATTALISITNADAATVWVTWLRLLGKGFFTEAPITIERTSVQQYGDRSIDIDLRYQNDINVAADLADYLLLQYEDPELQPGVVTLSPHTSDEMMRLALVGEIGNRLTLREEVLGIANDAFIHNININVREGQVLVCVLGLSASVFASGGGWILQDAASQLGTNTTLGFG